MLKTTPFDASRYLTSDEGIAAYLVEAYYEGGPTLVAHVLKDVVKAHARLHPEESGT